MQQIYTARDDMDAHFLQGLLEQEGITAVIQGEALEGAWGNVPVSARSLPSLWVNEEDVAKAKPVVDEYVHREESRTASTADSADAPAGSVTTWKCPKCGEEVEDQFDECWNCGADRPGAEAADDAVAAPEPGPTLPG